MTASERATHEVYEVVQRLNRRNWMVHTSVQEIARIKMEASLELAEKMENRGWTKAAQERFELALAFEVISKA